MGNNYEHNYCLKLNLLKIPGAKVMRLSNGNNVEECVCIPTSNLIYGEKKGGYWFEGTCCNHHRNNSFSHFIKVYHPAKEVHAMTMEERLAVPLVGVLKDTTLNREEQEYIKAMQKKEEKEEKKRKKEETGDGLIHVKKTTLIDYE